VALSQPLIGDEARARSRPKWRVWGDRDLPPVAVVCGTAGLATLSPALLSGLAGDAEPGADLGPGVTVDAQALGGLCYGAVDLFGQAEHEGQGLDVALADTAAVGAQDAADECSILVVLDLPPRSFLASTRP
jgi:hypothetical protein